MSAIEFAVKKVGLLDEGRARQLSAWLQASETPALPVAPLGARAMLGYARRFRLQPRTTADWMAELREGIATDGLHFLIGAFAELRDESV